MWLGKGESLRGLRSRGRDCRKRREDKRPLVTNGALLIIRNGLPRRFMRLGYNRSWRTTHFHKSLPQWEFRFRTRRTSGGADEDPIRGTGWHSQNWPQSQRKTLRKAHKSIHALQNKAMNYRSNFYTAPENHNRTFTVELRSNRTRSLPPG